VYAFCLAKRAARYYCHKLLKEGTLKVMLGEVVRQGLIPANPGEKVRRLKNDRKKCKYCFLE